VGVEVVVMIGAGSDRFLTVKSRQSYFEHYDNAAVGRIAGIAGAGAFAAGEFAAGFDNSDTIQEWKQLDMAAAEAAKHPENMAPPLVDAAVLVNLKGDLGAC